MSIFSRTLFGRLLLAQLLAAAGLLLVFGLLFYMERNLTVGRLVAERWAPTLQAAAQGQAGPAALPLAPTRQQTHAPAGGWMIPAAVGGPRVMALRTALRERGVEPLDLVFQADRVQPLVWVAVSNPQGQPVWLGFADELVEPRLPLRVVLALLLSAVVVLGISTLAARRLARPLELLRQQMQAHGPGAQAGAPPPPIPGSTTEILAIDTAWRGLLERLQRHERERALLLAGVSHDLRSPLARIRMAAELLPEAAGVAKRRDTIVRNIDSADRLIGSFLDHVRGATLPLNDTVDVAALARRLHAAHDRAASDFALDVPETPLWLPASHPLLLERLLANVVDNAFKHGQAPVCLRLRAEPDALCIEVDDAGAGIPPEQLPQLLQAFARGDASRHTPGTGLGLAVVTQAVERLGGKLQFSRPHGGGNRVSVWLPLDVAARPERV